MVLRLYKDELYLFNTFTDTMNYFTLFILCFPLQFLLKRNHGIRLSLVIIQ